jgi:hypothetical protein
VLLTFRRNVLSSYIGPEENQASNRWEETRRGGEERRGEEGCACCWLIRLILGPWRRDNNILSNAGERVRDSPVTTCQKILHFNKGKWDVFTDASMWSRAHSLRYEHADGFHISRNIRRVECSVAKCCLFHKDVSQYKVGYSYLTNAHVGKIRGNAFKDKLSYCLTIWCFTFRVFAACSDSDNWLWRHGGQHLLNYVGFMKCILVCVER